MKTRRNYRLMAYALFLIFAIFLVYGIRCECLSGVPDIAKDKLPCLVRILGPDFEKDDNGLLDVLGIIWTVTTGLVFFVIQYGYGKKQGLQIHNILTMVLNKVELVLISLLLLGKLLLYGYCHLFEQIWLLFILPIEGMLSLIVVVILLIRITNGSVIEQLIKGQIETSITKNNDKTFCRHFLSMAKGLEFDDNEECDKFVECVVYYLEKMDNIKEYIDRNMWSTDNVARASLQIKTITNLVDNIYAATQGGQRMLYVIQQCMFKSKSMDSFKIYLLMRSLVSRSVYAFGDSDLEKVLTTIHGPKQEEVLRYVSCYLQHMVSNFAEVAWASTLLNKFNQSQVILYECDEYKRVDTIENMLRTSA